MSALFLLALAVVVQVADPPASPPPAAPDDDEAPAFLPDDELENLAIVDVNAARPILRRSARSGGTATRALAARLLGAHDPSAATARICSRSLRVDVEPAVRRAGAECLGRVGVDLGGAHTPALVAALRDPNLDVVTMAGWALANVGEAASIGIVAELAHHEDPRVAQLFLTYAERMRTRLGLLVRPPEDSGRDAAGRRLVPSGYVLVTQAHGLDLAASTAWLGLYGGLMGWTHGAFLLSAHGGTAGAEAAALGGLAGAAIGAAAGSAYAFTRADSLPLAHTVVQLGTAGAFAGFGAGMLSGFPPTSAVTAANLSFVGTLAGTAAGVALVESRPPTLGALGGGLAAGLTLGTAAGALFRGYGLRDDTSIGGALLVGSTASVVTTLATADIDVGLFPITGAAVGGALGAGAGAGVMLLVEPDDFTEATGWGIAGGTVLGASALAIAMTFVPRDLDPLLSKELELFPPAVTAVELPHGEHAPAVVLAGRF